MGLVKCSRQFLCILFIPRVGIYVFGEMVKVDEHQGKERVIIHKLSSSICEMKF
jgi:hypothetical protein